MKIKSCYVPLLTAAYVSAHGFVWTLTINGQPYTGNIPAGTDSPSVIRQINTTFPNYGASNPSLNCGPNATAGTLVANANPGDTLTFLWKDVGLSNWPHDTGPMITYMANCGSTTCDKYDPTNANWFKIYQVGKQPNNSALWVQAEVMNGGVATVPLPKNLAAGNYMIRHEIIALHLATTKGKAEFYPSCSQVVVGGNETGAPNPNECVTFPGGYSDDDPGIYDLQVFDPSATYIFPGPPIAGFVGGTDNNSTSSSNSSSTVTALSTSSTTTSTAASGSPPPAQSSQASYHSCIVMMPSNTPAYTNEVLPRHFSRIMRRLFAFGGNRH